MALRDFVRTPTVNTSLRAPATYQSDPAPAPLAPAPSYSPMTDTRQLRTPAIAPYPGFTSGYNPDAAYSMYGPGGIQWSNTPYERSLRGGAEIAPAAPAPYNPGPAAPVPYSPGATPSYPYQPPGGGEFPGGVVTALAPQNPGTWVPGTPGTPGSPGRAAVPATAFEEWRNGQLIKRQILQQAQAAVAATAGTPGTPGSFQQLLAQLGR